MSEHVETLRRLRGSVGGEDTRAALTAAIEALDPPQDPAELRGLLRRAHHFMDRHLGDSDLEPGADPDQDLATAIAVALDAGDGMAAREAVPVLLAELDQLRRDSLQSTAELRAEVDLMAPQVYGDEADMLVLNRVASVRVPDDDGGVRPACFATAPDERTALLMLRGALRARLGR